MWQLIKELLGIKKGPSFKTVSWSEIESSWRNLELMASSGQQTDAKQALIQADILVDTIMKQAGAPGSNFGERLKGLRPLVDKGVYHKLWQAHIKRNELVHEAGSHIEAWERDQYLRAFREAISHFRSKR